MTADATSATPSADQNESIERSPSVRLSAASSINASRIRISKSPVTSINGSRNAAMTGGSSALRIAITAAAANAPLQLSTWAPGTIHAATSKAIVERIHARMTCNRPMRGRLGAHTAFCP